MSAREQYDVNSLAVPRKAQEAIGAITCLTHTDGRKMTINVEYNQLDPLLRATTHPEGDANDSSGWSPFPGQPPHPRPASCTAYHDAAHSCSGPASPEPASGCTPVQTRRM